MSWCRICTLRRRDQYRCWTEDLRPALYTQRRRVSWAGAKWTKPPAQHALAYYEREVDPLLTPITIDPSHPFPRVLNKALCLALLLRRKRKGATGRRARRAHRAACTAAPGAAALGTGTHDFIFLHDLIEHNVSGHVSRLRDSFDRRLSRDT